MGSRTAFSGRGLICDALCLNVREMGPADHIRTKHEMKALVASGGINEAEALAQRASERRAVNQSVTLKITMMRKREQRMSL